MNDQQLQKDMDEQQEVHERLMVPPVERVWIGRCSSPSAWYKDRIGDIVSVFAKDSYGYWTRDTGPMRLSQWIREDDAVPVGQNYPIMKSYKSIDVFENVPGRGTIFMVNIPTDEQLPKQGETILIDGSEYLLRYCEAGVGLFGRGKCVGLVVSKPIPAPQKQDLPQVDTKTLLRDITALKAKVQKLEEAVRNLTPNRLGPKPIGSAEFWSDELG